MGGPQCRPSVLRNVNVPCHYLLDSPVDFKIVQCRLSILRNGRVALSNLRVKGHHLVSAESPLLSPFTISRGY